MKLAKKFVIVTCVMGSLAGCSSSDVTETKAPAEQKEAEPVKVEEEIKEEIKEEVEAVEEEEIRDLGGRHIKIASWAADKEPEEKVSAYDEALWEYRNEMMEKHNFTMEQEVLGRWNEIVELLSTSSLAGDPAAQIFSLSTIYVPIALKNHLCYDLSTLDSIDLDHWKWDESVKDFVTRDGSTYGIFPDQPVNFFVFFNKRLFEEAGMDRDLLYDLQASGEWTWEKFEEICQKLTRDTDGDGLNDVFGLHDHSEVFVAAVMSNNTQLVDMDENGLFYNTSTSPETVEALEWIHGLYQKGYDVMSETLQSGAQNQLFMSGNVGMIVMNEHAVHSFQNMEDDFGLVAFPKGPNADHHIFGSVGSCWVIPAIYSKEEAEDIAFALDIWASQPPGYDEEDDWMLTEYKLYRDERAVEETLALARDPENIVMEYRTMIDGFSAGKLANPLQFQNKTVMETLESLSGTWNASIEKANSDR